MVLGMHVAYGIGLIWSTFLSTKRVAEVLREAGIEVRKVHGGWLECEPRPAGICEALSGELAEPHWVKQCNCPPEDPGHVLKLLADKGIQVTG